MARVAGGVLAVLRGVLPRRTLADMSGVSVVEQELRRLLGTDTPSLRVQKDPSRYNARVAGHCLPWVSVLHIESRASVDVRVTPAHSLDVIVPLKGKILLACSGDRWRVHPGWAYLGTPGDGYEASWRDDASALIFRLSKRLVTRAYQDLTGLPHPGPLQPAQYFDLDAGLGRSWVLALCGMLVDLDSPQSLVRAQITALAWQDTMVRTLLCLKSGANGQGVVHAMPRPPPQCMRRALDFISVNLDRDIARADLDKASGVAARTLHKWFTRYFGMTPLQYIRHLRLERVHADLTRPHRTPVTIGDIAARWGFLDGSRFAALYRSTFGELPSQTLRRA